MADGELEERRAEQQWPVVVTLKHPVAFGSETVTQITVRRGKLGDLKGIKLNGDDIAIDSLMTIASRMCGQPLKVIESLDPDDSGEVMALVLDFFGASLGGSKRPPQP